MRQAARALASLRDSQLDGIEVDAEDEVEDVRTMRQARWWRGSKRLHNKGSALCYILC